MDSTKNAELKEMHGDAWKSEARSRRRCGRGGVIPVPGQMWQCVRCNIIYCLATSCTVLQHPVPSCNILYCLATSCTVLQHAPHSGRTTSTASLRSSSSARGRLSVICCMPHAACCMLLAARCLLSVACRCCEFFFCCRPQRHGRAPMRARTPRCRANVLPRSHRHDNQAVAWACVLHWAGHQPCAAVGCQGRGRAVGAGARARSQLGNLGPAGTPSCSMLRCSAPLRR